MPATPLTKSDSAKNTKPYNMTISQSHPRPLWFRWRENHPITLYEAFHVRQEKPTDLLRLQISLNVWNVTDGFSKPTVNVSHTVFLTRTVCECACVCDCVCVFGCDRGVSRLHRPWWMGHCVSVCVLVRSNVALAHSFFSSMQNILPLKYWSYLSSPRCLTAHKKTPSPPDVADCTNDHFIWASWFTGVCYFTCQTSLLLSCHGSFLPRASSTIWWLTPADKWQSAKP